MKTLRISRSLQGGVATEEAHGESLLYQQEVRWNLCDKWYSDRRHRIEPVSVGGRPEENDVKVCEPEWTDDNPKPGSVAYLDKQAEEAGGKESGRIMVDIWISNGMQMCLSEAVRHN